MRLWTLIKLVAGAVVLAITVFTGLLLWHVTQKPLGGVFAQIVPLQQVDQPVVEKLPEPDASLPDVDPGAKVFEKASELIAVGDMGAARERLGTVVGTYPRSKAAPEARRIVGEMNVDELLSASHMQGKEVYIVRSGDYYIGIALKYKTSLDNIMHLNGLMDLKGLRPGEELVVMPLNLRVQIEPAKKVLSLWDGKTFVKEYPLLATNLGNLKGPMQTEISSLTGMVKDSRYTPGQKEYPGAEKVFMLKKTTLQIRAVEDSKDGGAEELTSGPGFHLSVEDSEELALLLRPGNEVEIRAVSP
ncbi:LysM domain-containing protein [Haloferula sp. BvORR071]|uniref:LysM peptidoglycan-binding domain-containing protein n=1 Tax=Haloferula sp. BvORR071 TaxID=1396141 RepID=UPI00054E5DA6|nr:LysM domain-containing protein [Haloferula sp. BvORR071]